jgi:hypothetical protein
MRKLYGVALAFTGLVLVTFMAPSLYNEVVFLRTAVKAQGTVLGADSKEVRSGRRVLSRFTRTAYKPHFMFELEGEWVLAFSTDYSHEWDFVEGTTIDILYDPDAPAENARPVYQNVYNTKVARSATLVVASVVFLGLPIAGLFRSNKRSRR